MLALAGILREEAEVLDGLVDEAVRGRSEIELVTLRSLPVAIQRLVPNAWPMPRPAAPRPGRPAGRRRWLPWGRAALDLPHGVRAVVKRGVLRFECQTPGARSAERERRP